MWTKFTHVHYVISTRSYYVFHYSEAGEGASGSPLTSLSSFPNSLRVMTPALRSSQLVVQLLRDN